MNDKIAKEIAKELRLIRIELQKMTSPPEQQVQVDEEKLVEVIEDSVRAGERVTI